MVRLKEPRLIIRIYQRRSHFHYYFSNKWQGPGKDVHDVWQPIRMGYTGELPKVHYVVFVSKSACTVVINVQIVRRAEDRHERRKACRGCFSIHLGVGRRRGGSTSMLESKLRELKHDHEALLLELDGLMTKRTTLQM